MRTLWTVTGSLALIASLAFLSTTFGNRSARPTETIIEHPPVVWGGKEEGDEFVVHEWGTFTNFSGSDGVYLEFRPLVDNDLPGFVLDRARQAGSSEILRKRAISVRQRMETPVTYFYTDRERDIRVKVGFPEGLLTELYPPAESMQPPYDRKKQLDNSELDWGRVHLIPPEKMRPAINNRKLAEQLQTRMVEAALPNALDYSYHHARATDSALVHVHRAGDTKNRLVPRGDFMEKFLFYRGVGNFSLPLRLEHHGDNRFELTNNGQHTIRGLFLVDIRGKSIRFQEYDQIAAGETLQLTGSTEDRKMTDLSRAVIKALIAEGLYPKEAISMVKTWQSSWFGEAGTRLFYMVPEPVTDKLLPLTIAPQPQKVVRVLVGRMEIMSQQLESQLTAVVAENARQRAAIKKSGERRILPIPDEIRNLGRLAEPALFRVGLLSKDPAVKNEASYLIHGIRSIHNN